MSTTVAIVNWNSGERLHGCIDSLLATTTHADVLVVDNASEDDSLSRVLSLRDRVNFVRNSVNRGLAAAVNQAFAVSDTPYVLLLNPDVRVVRGAISVLEEFLDAHPRTGAIGGYVNERYLPRQFPTICTLIRENVGIPKRPAPYDPTSPAIAVDQPAAAALMVRRDAYDEVGGLDEQFYPAWYEDVDFCRRLKSAGWNIYFAPQARFIHEGGYSASALGAESFARAYYSNQVRYARKHMGGAAAALIRASIAVGMLARMVARPRGMKSQFKTMLGAIRGW
jgi:GT2 family glycosyltransferase